MIKIIENTLIIKVEERSLRMIAGALPVSGSRGCDSCMFLLSGDDWEGLEKSAVFWQDPARRYEVPLGKGDSCLVPDEAIEEDGCLFLGLIGRRAGILQNSKVLSIPLCDGTREGNAKAGGRG